MVEQSMMRAVVLDEFGGELRLGELPVPSIGPGEVLLRVRSCAVDRFDLAIRAGGREQATVPHVLGHEISGTVAEVGPGVDRWSAGDRVAVSLYLVCGSCRWCLRGRETICENFAGHIGVTTHGGYAEYVVVPARNLVSIPSEIDYPEASILANAIGTPFHALTARMGLQPGEKLVITGAGGGVGLHAVQLGSMLGAAVMAVDIGPRKLEVCEEMGAEVVVDPTERDLGAAIHEWTSGVGADAVLEMVGKATMDATLGGLAKGGRMVIVGSHTGTDLVFDTGAIYRNEWEIRGSRNVSVDELATVVDLVARGLIRPIIDELHPFDDVEALHNRVREGTVIGRDVLIP